MTPPTSASDAANRTANHPRSQRPSEPEPPRRQAENRSLSERFSSKLERAGDDNTRNQQRAGESSDGARSSQSRSRDFDSLSGESGQQGDADLARGDMSRLVRTEHSSAAAQLSSANAADTAILERMAARIAESWPGTDLASAEVDFPPGSLAQSALLTRQADGSVAIRIAGLDPKLNALRAGYAQLALLHGLDRRRLKIASLIFEKPERNQPGRDSTIPATV